MFCGVVVRSGGKAFVDEVDDACGVEGAVDAEVIVDVVVATRGSFLK